MNGIGGRGIRFRRKAALVQSWKHKGNQHRRMFPRRTIFYSLSFFSDVSARPGRNSRRNLDYAFVCRNCPSAKK
jgi:hypothetical protein